MSDVTPTKEQLAVLESSLRHTIAIDILSRLTETARKTASAAVALMELREKLLDKKTEEDEAETYAWVSDYFLGALEEAALLLVQESAEKSGMAEAQILHFATQGGARNG